MAVKVAVIGAGIVGVSSAYRILTSLPNVEVTILAEKTLPHITSQVAAGLWIPHVLANTPVELQRRWSFSTWDHLQELQKSEESSEAGVALLSGCMVHTEETPLPVEGWQERVRGFRTMTKEELADFPGQTCGWFFTTFVAVPTTYIPWMLNKFKRRGGHFIQTYVDSPEQLFGEYDIVVNCTGVDAYSFAKDKEVIPVRGQVMTVDAPWMNHFVIQSKGDAYIIPIPTGLTILGGTHQYGNWNRQVDAADTNNIFTECCKVVPSLKKARVVEEMAGLRPGRTTLRLELEYKSHQGKTYPVIHNYGHGGSGITLHWGTAVDTAELVKSAISNATSRL